MQHHLFNHKQSSIKSQNNTLNKPCIKSINKSKIVGSLSPENKMKIRRSFDNKHSKKIKNPQKPHTFDINKPSKYKKNDIRTIHGLKEEKKEEEKQKKEPKWPPLKNNILTKSNIKFEKEFHAKYEYVSNITNRTTSKINKIKSKGETTTFKCMKDVVLNSKTIQYSKYLKDRAIYLMTVYDIAIKYDIIEDGEIYFDPNKERIHLVHKLYDIDLGKYYERHTITPSLIIKKQKFPNMFKDFGLDNMNMFQNDTNKNVGLLLKLLAPKLKILHDKSLVYMDLKPYNICMNYNKDTHQPIEFGLIDPDTIRHVGRKLIDFCEDKICVGTLAYLPPENFDVEGKKNGFTTKYDIWSLGVTLFELITSEHPYSPYLWKRYTVKEMDGGLFDLGDTVPQELMNNIILMNDTLNKTENGSLPHLILKMLQIDPMKRYDINDVIQHEWYRVNCT